MQRFALGLALHLGAAAIGLVAFALLASAFQWIEPVWWGGKALFVPMLGVIIILMGALPVCAVLFALSRRELPRDAEIAYPYLGYGATGLLIGALWYPMSIFSAPIGNEIGIHPIALGVMVFVFVVALSIFIFRPHVRRFKHAS